MTNEARRLVIVAGCYADAAPAIGLATVLAGQVRAVVVGVMALDPTLEAAAGAPELPARPRRQELPALSAEGLGRAWAADARAFSARLSQAAKGASLHWEFRTDRGVSVELACAIRQPGDMVLVGQRRLTRLRGPVVTLGLGPDSGAEGLALLLARALRVRVLALPAEAADGAESIEAMPASVLILAPAVARDPARLARIVEAARCPVLIAPDTETPPGWLSAS